MTGAEQRGTRGSDTLWVINGGRRSEAPVLITGGAGFVGSNLAHRLLRQGRRVVVFDNLSRPGVERNLRWLRQEHGSAVDIVIADVRHPDAVRRAVARAGQVFHFAAQVAVTTSLEDPLKDFEVNVRGTLNLLEAARSRADPPAVVFTSTNKVYGGLEDLVVARRGSRYEPVDDSLRTRGIGEDRGVDFHSPYGCSKGAADQYTVDYARSFGLDTVAVRMSCVYGPRQFGTEDQGWIAHFILRALEGEPITIFGDGMQVRDILYIDDLVDALLLAARHVDRLKGRAYNIGGGPANAVSLLEVVDTLGDIAGRRPALRLEAWRPGDQRYYVSDTSRFREATGWMPRVAARDGIERLYDWLSRAREAWALELPAAQGLV